MGMSRIELFCDDRQVGAVLRSLAGIAQGTPKVTPVVNAIATKDGVKQATTGETLTMFAAWARKHKLLEVDAAGIRKFLSEIGRPASVYSYILKMLKQEKLVKQIGKGMRSRYRLTLGNGTHAQER